MRFLISGPCTLESMQHAEALSTMAHRVNLPYLRAMIYKPRTRPNSFQGLGESGLGVIRFLIEKGHRLCSEACSYEQLAVVAKFADIVQIGARNMQNFELLKLVGKNKDLRRRRPFIMLKRGFSATEAEWLGAAAYLEESGIEPEQIILCERGSRTTSAPYGVSLDLGLAWKVKNESEYAVICDPSHGSKNAQLVAPLTKAIVAMGFDGAMIESHPKPCQSVSDADQAISFSDFEKIVQALTLDKHFDLSEFQHAIS